MQAELAVQQTTRVLMMEITATAFDQHRRMAQLCWALGKHSGSELISPEAEEIEALSDQNGRRGYSINVDFIPVEGVAREQLSALALKNLNGRWLSWPEYTAMGTQLSDPVLLPGTYDQEGYAVVFSPNQLAVIGREDILPENTAVAVAYDFRWLV